MEQRSIEWHNVRLGKFTASEIHKLMGIKGIGQTGESYILEKVTEILTGLQNEISTPAMQWGTELEPYAIEHFLKIMPLKSERLGFKELKDFEKDAGCSPDLLLPEIKKGVEIKCPFNRINHTRNLLLKNQKGFFKEHSEYYYQIQMQMLCFDFDSWFFVSYHPDFEGKNRMLILEIKKDFETQIKLIERLEIAIKLKNEFLAELK